MRPITFSRSFKSAVKYARVLLEVEANRVMQQLPPMSFREVIEMVKMQKGASHYRDYIHWLTFTKILVKQNGNPIVIQEHKKLKGNFPVRINPERLEMMEEKIHHSEMMKMGLIIEEVERYWK